MLLPVTSAQIAKLIDHSLLHPTMTDDDIRKGMDLAVRYNVASCCVKPFAVAMARQRLEGTGVRVCSVMAFPHGNQTIRMKLAEAADCIANGATELDMVINIGKAIGGDWGYVQDEIRQVNELTVANGAKLKVIFENDYLQDDQIIRLCQICSSAKVGWVKTSTGYGFVKQPDGGYNYKGATEHHLRLMRQHTDPSVGLKAAGGVRTLADLLKVHSLGCSRVGATATATILEDARKAEKGQALGA